MLEKTDMFRLMATSFVMTSHTAWYPDAGLPERFTVDAHVRLGFGALAGAGVDGTFRIDVEPDVMQRLLERADAAIARGGDIRGTDTAVGRFITTLELATECEHIDKLTRASISINHYAIRGTGPVEWRLLLDEVYGTLASVLGDNDREHGEFLRLWFCIPGPTPAYDARQVVPVGGTTVEAPVNDGVFIRIGQSGDTRGLFAVGRHTYVGVRILDMTTNEPVVLLGVNTNSWSPGGELTVSYDHHLRPNQVTIDAMDSRHGVFIQAAAPGELTFS